MTKFVSHLYKQTPAIRIWIFAVVCIAIPGLLFAQPSKPPFWEDIQSFKKQDSIHAPSSGSILFAGSSSFTKWTDLPERFPGFSVINRGFGGSTLLDLIFYSKEVILAYHPRQIVIYCGENDFAASDTVGVDVVVARFVKLFELIRAGDRKVWITYISMKPSPSRTHLLPKFTEANGKIKSFLKGMKRTSYIEVYSKMLNPDGTIMGDLFVEDQLHMNAKGYDIWQREINPYLRK